jgi:hypothetical protein
MKKYCLILLLILWCSTAFSELRLQGQAGLLGTGYGLGLGQQIIPFLLDGGLEGSMYSIAPFKSVGSYNDDNLGLVQYSGEIGLTTTRVGGYFKFNFPLLDLVPVIGILGHPTLHFGTQNGIASVTGEVRPLNNGIPIEAATQIKGSYFSLGFPSYLGPLFIEPSFGSQHIFLPGYGNYKNTIDASLAIGFSI